VTSAELNLKPLGNGRAVDLTEIPQLSFEKFESTIIDSVVSGLRIVAYFGVAVEGSEEVDLYAVVALDSENRLGVGRTRLQEARFQSLTPDCPQVHLFEREIAEQFGLEPIGHPWFKPVRYRKSWNAGRDAWKRASDSPITVGVTDYYRVEGEEVHEVAVGPVHAGVIEPGHFRFQCHGEQVFHLEISLGYQHRGIEEAMLGGPSKRSIHYAETTAGDTTVAHTMAYCQVIEALSRCKKTPRAQSLRGIALELERIANHVGDLGALANDVGFLPTASFCGRLRGDYLNMTALLCGNRFGRGMIQPGGVGFDVDPARVEELIKRLDIVEKDTTHAINLLWDTPSVMARFEDTGPLPLEVCKELGIVGPAARASGLDRDIRVDQPSSVFRFVQIPVSTLYTGDVFARAYVRWLEIQHSIIFVREQLGSLPAGSVKVGLGGLAPNQLALSLIEGWRGELCHVAITDSEGRFRRYKIVDPSFHNWVGLAYSMRNQQISDFPLCNKSFNLSYCGYDL
jgi:Ni,Fe-hydrogenase III large subunit